MKILLWQTAFLGDLILTTSLVRCVKQLYSDAYLIVVSKPFGKEVFKYNPHVDELILFDKKKDSFLNLVFKLRQKQIDLAISPHRSHRATLAIFLSGIKTRIGFDKAGFSFLYTKTCAHRFSGEHEIIRNLKLLTTLKSTDVSQLDLKPCLYLQPQEQEFLTKWQLNQSKYVVIAPGSKWPTKRWTVQGFKDVVRFLQQRDFQVVLMGGKEDVSICEEIGLEGKVLNLAGKTSLRESFALISKARLLVSNDSAPVHMAVALNTPVVAIFGPTVKEFGFYPFQKGEVVEIDMDCRPCGLHGHKKCPLEHHRCMRQISSQKVIQVMGKFLTTQD
ncbi:MAG: lipopolysaccharide heptosyltransferase II [Desulfonauticus sp.]|nr:lipopolysaccharide heptosyltransferase II [Desulfonauticus sp.]